MNTNTENSFGEPPPGTAGTEIKCVSLSFEISNMNF